MPRASAAVFFCRRAGWAGRTKKRVAAKEPRPLVDAVGFSGLRRAAALRRAIQHDRAARAGRAALAVGVRIALPDLRDSVEARLARRVRLLLLPRAPRAAFVGALRRAARAVPPRPPPGLRGGGVLVVAAGVASLRGCLAAALAGGGRVDVGGRREGVGGDGSVVVDGRRVRRPADRSAVGRLA